MDEQESFYQETEVKFRRLVSYKIGKPLNSEEVDDVVFNAYTEIFKAWDSFRGESKRISWAQTIVERCAYKFIKKQQRERKQVAAYFAEYGIEEDTAPLNAIMAHSVDFRYSAIEYNLLDFDFIKRAYNLTDSQIDTLKVIIHELTTEEAAEKLNCTPKNVYVRIHRLRQVLSRFFDDVPEFPNSVE